MIDVGDNAVRLFWMRGMGIRYVIGNYLGIMLPRYLLFENTETSGRSLIQIAHTGLRRYFISGWYKSQTTVADMNGDEKRTLSYRHSCKPTSPHYNLFLTAVHILDVTGQPVVATGFIINQPETSWWWMQSGWT